MSHHTMRGEVRARGGGDAEGRRGGLGRTNPVRLGPDVPDLSACFNDEIIANLWTFRDGKISRRKLSRRRMKPSKPPAYR
jgi:hypothetical protein